MTDVQVQEQEKQDEQPESASEQEQPEAEVKDLFGFELLSDGVEEVDAASDVRRDLTRHLAIVDSLPMNDPSDRKKKRIRIGVRKGDIITDDGKNKGRGENELSEFAAFQAAAFQLKVGLRITLDEVPGKPDTVQFILVKVPRKEMSDEQKKSMRRARLEGEIKLANETTGVTMTEEQLKAATDRAVLVDNAKKEIRAAAKVAGKRLTPDEIAAEAEKQVAAAEKKPAPRQQPNK